MTPEELAIKHFPYNTSCPMKRKKIDWQRENLAKDIKEQFSAITALASAVSSLTAHSGTDLVYHYSPKKESK